MTGDDPEHDEQSATTSSHVSRLRRSLASSAEAIESGDSRRSDESISDLVQILDSVLPSDDDGDEASRTCEEALVEVHTFVSSDSSNREVVEGLGLMLPRAVARLGGVSERHREVAESIIECFVTVCDPREMVSVLCEGLDYLRNLSKNPIQFALLLSGLSKVFPCIKRRQLEQLKTILPIVLNVLHDATVDSDCKGEGFSLVCFDPAVAIATSIKTTLEKVEVGRMKQELNAILGLYVLQVMALLSRRNLSKSFSHCTSYMMRLSHFLPLCGLSYMGLLTGADIGAIAGVLQNENDDSFMACFPFIKDGALLAVIWGFISDEVANAAGQQLVMVLDNLRGSQVKRWQALDMLKYVLSSLEYPWKIKAHTIDLLLSMMEKQVSSKQCEDLTCDPSLFLSIYACMQAIVKILIYAPDPSLRKNSFVALKKVLSDIPSSQQFDMLKSLIANNDSPSMIALLVDTARDKVFMENYPRISLNMENGSAESKMPPIESNWSLNALELVELILKPPKGGPPSLPEDTDPVLSALNLYRFILLKESAGERSSEVLSESNLCKAYTEWLLPLRTLLSGLESETNNCSSEVTSDILCSINPLQLVLHRCIELVEDLQSQKKK